MIQNMPAVGVGIIIRRGSQVLLLRRKGVHGDGCWSTPGGHLDFCESLEACAIREAKEETNLNVDRVRFVAITNDVFEVENRLPQPLFLPFQNLIKGQCYPRRE